MTDLPDTPTPTDKEQLVVRKQAQEILYALHQQREETLPRAESNNLARPLVEELRQALTYSKDEDLTTKLEHQANALDSAFRRLLSNADTTFENNTGCEAAYTQYAVAFKAQDLFCRTARALNILKEKQNSKKRSKNKKPRRVKRTIKN
jgi:hypothetical protein